MEALGFANYVRLNRAKLKRNILNGSVAISEVIADPPDYMETCTVLELLCSQRRWRDRRATKFLSQWPNPTAHRTLGSLTKHERDRMISELEGKDG
jgi:hypothetical protein